MITGYIKAVGTDRMTTKWVGDTEEDQRSVALPGFIRWQEQFFFNGRDPDSVKRAFDAACRHATAKQGTLSIYGLPEMAGPWDDLPRVGQGIGED